MTTRRPSREIPAGVLLAILGFLFSIPALANAPFGGEQTIIASLNSANRVQAGELDGVAGADIFAGSEGDSVLNAALQQAGITWSTQNLTPGSKSRGLELADLDGDGDLDLVYGDFNGNKVYWRTNDLDVSGTFLARQEVASLGRAQGVTAADIDGDTDLDVLIAGRTADGYFWAENVNGDGTTWTTHTIASSVNAAQVAVAADIDGDGDLDVAGGSSSGSGKLAWYENVSGDGLSWVARDIYSSRISSVAAGDLDLDGDIDLLVQDTVADDILWWENTAGDGTAWTSAVIEGGLPDASPGLQAVDLDFDGDLDVIGSRAGDWHENINKASSWTRRSYSGGTDMVDTDVVDLDEDGDLDIVSARLTADRVSWWPNLTCSPGDADDDSDGVRNACDVCDGFDDTVDSDGDLTPDGCDLCPGEDDRVDADGGGVPDACEGAASIAINNVTLAEDNSGTTSFNFTVTLAGTVAGGFTVDYSTQDQTATVADGDYVADSGTLMFAGTAGEQQAITVSVSGDAKTELDEVFLVVLGTPSSGSVAVDDDTGNGTIANDDTAFLSIDDPMMDEGDSGTSNMVFTVTLAGEVDSSFSVNYDTDDFQATVADSDYLPVANSLTFDGNDGEQETILVPVVGDTKVEADEAFRLHLRLPTSRPGVTSVDGTGFGRLRNDDTATVAIDDVDRVEGDSGTSTYTFTVTLTGNVAGGFTVPYATADGTATVADGDYVAASGTLNFAGTDGEAQTISVNIQGDGKVEGDETFTVGLGTPSKLPVTASDGTGIGTVRNDDSATVAINDVSLMEGDSGNTTYAFTVTLTGGVAGGFTLPYATADGTATVADTDYAAASSSLNFAGTDGETQTISIGVQGDDTVEVDETFTVDLGTPSNTGVSATDGSGLGTLRNDDSATIAIDDVSQMEGDSGTTTYTFTVTLTGSVAGGFTVPYSTADGTATIADSDYAAASSSLSFAGTDGETQTISIDVQGDDTVEDDETFTVDLGTPSNASVTATDDTGLGTLRNDDSATVAIDDVDQVEGDSGTTTYSFTVTLSGSVAGGFTVPYSTADGTATVADADYAAASSSLNFVGTDGETQTISIDVQGDDTVEVDETFTVDLGTPSNASVTATNGSGLGTLRNDDSATIAIDDVSQMEGDSGTTTYTFTVTLTGNVVGGFTVPYDTTDATATTADSDYAAASSSLSFAGTNGETQMISIDVQGDDTVEVDEIFTVDLGTPSNASVTATDRSGLGTLRNDDSATIAIDDVDQVEGDSGTTTYTFAVTLTGNVAGGFTVPYATADGTATTADADYTMASGNLGFVGTDGETQAIAVDVQGDTKVELNESFSVQLDPTSHPSVSLADHLAIGTIQNEDDGPILVATKEISSYDPSHSIVVYRIVLTNLGNGGQLDNPTSDEFEDLLPGDLGILNAMSDSPDFLISIDTTANAAYGNGTLASGEVVTVILEAAVHADGGTEISNQATVRFDTDRDGVNESLAVTDDPSQPGTVDATVFTSISPLEIPTLGSVGIGLLVCLLAAVAVRFLNSKSI